ncbi:hypothetical protein ES708_17484 [subsurface metagenome]
MPAGVQPLPAGAINSLPAGAHTKEKKETRQKKRQKIGDPPKKQYGEFNNVLLTDEEYQKLKDRFGVKVPDMIEALSQGIESREVYLAQRLY